MFGALENGGLCGRALYKITKHNELILFWRYANKRPEVWVSLLSGRVEHATLGCGTIVEVAPKLGGKDGPKVYVRVLFDEPKTSRKGTKTKSKLLLLPYVLDKDLLKWLVVPRAIASAFLPLAAREVNRPLASIQQEGPPPLPPHKKYWRNFQEVVEKHRIRNLYHFTDSRNLNSIIRNGGLYSWWQCKQRRIGITAPGGDENSRWKDKEYGLQDYVRLGFNAHLPMMYVAQRAGRLKHTRILRIDPSVIYLEPTLFSDMNANDREARVGTGVEDFRNIDFGLATGRWWEGQEEKRRFQAEVLVKSHVPLNLIRNL